VNIPQLNSNTNWLQDKSSERTMQKTQPLHCCRGMYIMPLHRKDHSTDHTEDTFLLLLCMCLLRVLPSNGRRLPSHCLAMGSYATLLQIFYALFTCGTLTQQGGLKHHFVPEQLRKFSSK
jgi:hypothetical protein